MDPISEGQIQVDQSSGELTGIAALDLGHVPRLREVAGESFDRLWEPADFVFFLNHECRLCLGLFEVGTKAGNRGSLEAYFLGLLVCGELDVISVATSRSCRRRGYAEALMRHVLALGQVSRAFLEVDTKNIAAFALYEKLGFKTIATRKGYYARSKDAYVMSLVKV